MVSQIKVNEIIKQSGSSITIGESGDTVSVPSGATLNVAGSTSGLPNNTPSFFASLSSNQSISSATTTKVQFNSETFDTNSAYDNSSNYRFTVPSGEGGKYYFVYNIDCHSLDTTQLQIANGFFYKNGSAVSEQSSDFRNNLVRRFCLTNSIVLDLSASDYVEVFGNVTDDSGSPQFSGGSPIMTYFGGYKLV